MKKAFLCAALAGAVLSLSACTSPATHASKTAEPVQLSGTSWMLPIEKEADCDTPPILEFGPDYIAGDLGCNRFRGNYTLEGNRLTITYPATTRRMCAPGLMQLEARMLEAINNVVTVAIVDKGLVFYDKDGKVLITLVPEMAGSC